MFTVPGSVVRFVVQNHRAVQMLQNGTAMLKLRHVQILHSVNVFGLSLNADSLCLEFYSCGIYKKI
jgi:hypothetical protein